MTRRTSALAALVLLTACGAAGPMMEAADKAPEPVPYAVSLSRAVEHEGQFGTEVDAVVERQLIKTGSVTVRVKEYAAFSKRLDTWLGESNGFVADVTLSHREGDVSYADLTLRVPADDFDAMIAFLEGEFEVEHLSVQTADVTEQYVDLNARLDNAKRTETRLANILERDADDLSDVLAVERELARVRGEIESYEGRLRVLQNQIDLGTLRLSVQVDEVYTPPQTPTFAQQAQRTLTGSLSAMGMTARGVSLAAIAAAPWLALLTAFATVLLGALRAVVRRFSAG